MNSIRLVCAIGLIAGLSAVSNAQQSALYVGTSPNFTQIVSGGAGTITLPAGGGTMLTSGSNGVIDGLLTLGVNGAGGTPGQLNINNGSTDSIAFLWSGGAFNMEFTTPSNSPAGLNITGQAAFSGAGGAVSISGGSGTMPGLGGGAASLTGGTGLGDPGGEASVTGGPGENGGDGGEAAVQGGSGGGTAAAGGAGGELLLSSGAGGGGDQTGGDGGVCIISAGAGGTAGSTNGGNGGSVSISGGAGGGAGPHGRAGWPGDVSIQTTAGNTSIGNSGGQVSISATNWGVTGASGAATFAALSTGTFVGNMVTDNTGTYNVGSTEYTIVETNTTGAIVTLPLASLSTGRVITIKYGATSGTMTVDPNSSDQSPSIDNRSGCSLVPSVANPSTPIYSSITVQCDGTSWWIIGSAH